MARKLTRYKVNRQYRKNPTRSRVFFPYRLPFQRDYRLVTDDGTEVSAATSARWRRVVADISGNKRTPTEVYEQEQQQILEGLQRIRKFQRRGIVGAAQMVGGVIKQNFYV